MSSNDKENILSLNRKVFKIIRITSHEQMLLNCIEDFYKDKENAKKLIELINGEISIRLIDFFITSYSKKNRINYFITNNEKDKVIFNVYSSYKSQLKAWNKRYFDPFSRGIRIPYFLNDDCLITTIGQLNFFKWFISNNIYIFIKENISKIELEMNSNKKVYKYNLKKKKYKSPKIVNNIKYNSLNLNCTETKKSEKIEVRFD
jgi:hypothetical protein